jgi:DNA repair protein RadC
MTVPACMIRELSPDERPRERMLAHGSRSLSDAELLAVLLRTGRPGMSALAMAREILREWGSLAGLGVARVTNLKREGLGMAKATSLLAAVEIGRRLARAQLPVRRLLSRPDEVANYLTLRYCNLDQEVMGAVFLDTRNRLIDEREIYRGTLNRAAVEPRAILKEALLLDAAGVLLFHTHPSGDPSPSAEDLLFTRRMAEAGELVGVRLVDHMVLGARGRWVSLRQRGW